MDAYTRQAYEWALNQDFPSVAARYSKTLAIFIKNTRADEERIRRETIEECKGAVANALVAGTSPLEAVCALTERNSRGSESVNL